MYVQADYRDAAKRTLVWVDREGREEPLGAAAKPYSHPRLSPDGTRIAVNSRDQERDIWIFDLARLDARPADVRDRSGAESRVDAGQFLDAVRVTPRDRGRQRYRQRADGTGSIEALTSGKNYLYPIPIAPNGREVWTGQRKQRHHAPCRAPPRRPTGSSR